MLKLISNREMQMESTTCYHQFTPMRSTNIKKTGWCQVLAGGRCGWGKCGWFRHSGATGQCMVTWNILIPWGATIQSLKVCHIPTFSLVHKETCMRIEALFVVTGSWRRLGCPSQGKWTGKKWRTPLKEYQIVVRRSGLASHLAIKMEC